MTPPPPARPPAAIRRLTPDQRRRIGREFVAATAISPYGANALASLPQPIDDLARDFGNDIYQQMLLDAQVAACVNTLKTSILEDGPELSPAVADQADPRYRQAVEIRDRAARMLATLETPFDDVLWTMLDAMSFGNKVAEIVNVLERDDGRTWLRIRAIKPKPRQSVAFVVDAYLNLIGILGADAGQQSPQAGAPLTPGDPRILPRDRFAILTWRPQDNDPRGTSILRPAYEAWWRKRQMFPEYLRYLTQFAGPSLWGTTPEGTTIDPLTDPLGNPIDAAGASYDPAEDPASIPPAPLGPTDLLLQALLDFRNGTALAVPAGTEVNAIEMQGNGEAFLACFSEADRQITHSILSQELATESTAQHQTRAAAQVHQDVLDTLVRQGKLAVVRMIEHDVLTPWVLANWGQAAADLVPQVSLGTTERQDLAQVMTAVAQLQRAGYLHPSQHPAIDRLISLPVRDLSRDDSEAQLQPVDPDDDQDAGRASRGGRQ